jgi:alpha-galactosidase
MNADISETAVLAAAHLFVSLGLREAGYEYVNIDVCLQLLLSSCPLNIYNTSGLLVPDQSPPRHKRIGS